MNNYKPTVFISHCHESQEHNKKVLEFAINLRKNDIDAEVDLLHKGEQIDWVWFMQQKIEKSDFVLCVCTAGYRERIDNHLEYENKGVVFEWTLIGNLFSIGTRKFIPVILSEDDAQYIPTLLVGENYFRLWDKDDADSLISLIKRQTKNRIIDIEENQDSSTNQIIAERQDTECFIGTLNKMNSYPHQNLSSNNKVLCDNYIARTVQYNKSEIQSDSLFDIVKNNKNIVLLGHAGTGKSEELKHLFNVCNENGYSPFLYLLKDYFGQEIEGILPSNFDKYRLPIIILDAFDEIPSNFVSEFVSKINTYANIHQCVQIVISTRSNFYESKYTQTFNDFEVVKLNALTKEDVKQYFKENNISDNLLNDPVLNICLDVPFYLAEVLRLIKVGEKFNCQLDIMQCLLQIAINNYQNKQIERNIINIEEKLQELAISLIRKGKMSEVDYQSELLKFDWIEKDRTGIHFIHNNFKEFLAAKYLSMMSVECIESEICLTINGVKYIKPQYFNVLGFLLELKKDNINFIEFLKHHGKEILMHSEIDIISDKDKSNLVVSIVEEYETKKSWLDSFRYDLDDLAKYSDNLTTVRVLINYVDLKYSRTTVISVLKILSKTNYKAILKKNLYDKVVGFLTEKTISSDAYFLTTVIEFIDTIANDINVSKELFSRYFEDRRSTVRAAVNKILYKHKLGSFYINKLIENKQKCEVIAYEIDYSDDEDVMAVEEEYYLSLAIKEVIEEDSLIALGRLLLTREYDDSKILDDWMFAVENVKEPSSELQSFLVSAFVDSGNKFIFRQWNSRMSKLIKNNKLEYKCFDLILLSDLPIWNKVDLLALIYVDGLKDRVIDLFCIPEVKQYGERFVSLIRRFNGESNQIEIELSKMGIKYKTTDYDKVKIKQKIQNEFDGLFDTNIIINNILAIFDLCKKDSVSWEDVAELNYDDCKNYPQYARKFFSEEADCSREKIVNLKIGLYWQIFQMFDYLKDNDNIIVSDQQKQFIKQWCDDNISKIDFTKAITYNKDGDGWSTNLRAILISFFIRKFNFDYDTTIYESMTCFDYGGNSSNSLVLDYVKAKIGKDATNKAIKKYMEADFFQDYFLDSRLNFLIKNECDFGREYILSQLEQFAKIRTTNYYMFVKYICYFNFEEDALCYYDNFNDDFKLKLIVEMAKTKSSLAIKYGEQEISKDSSNAVEIAKQLIGLNSRLALKCYIKWFKNDKLKAEQFDEFDLPNFGRITDFECVDDLLELLKCSYSLSFKHNLLPSSINNSLEKIALQSFERMEYIVKELINIANMTELNGANYEHYYIDEIINNYLWNSHSVVN